MHSFRYPQNRPLMRPSADGAEEPQAGGGSLTGTAFAISAAVMPLLRSRDLSVCSGALSLLRKSLQLCVEPLWCIDGESALEILTQTGVSEETALEMRDRMNALCTERIQHLLSRLEQVTILYLSFYQL